MLDFKTQERYYTKIVERYMTFCSDAGERDELLRRFASLDLNITSNTGSDSKGNQHSSSSKKPGPNSNAADNHASLSATPRVPSSSTAPSLSSSSTATATPSPATIPTDTKALTEVLSALRKLREGIVASKRSDDFAVQAYLFCIRLSVLVKHPESYHPAILHLLRRMTTTITNTTATTTNSTVLTTVEHAEVASYLVLDAACRRADLTEAHALRRRHGVRDAKVDGVLRALAHDDWAAFARLRSRVDGHRARLLEWAEPALRRHLLKCFARAYLSVDRSFLERCAGAPWEVLTAEEGVGWELEEGGGKVVIRRVRAKGGG